MILLGADRLSRFLNKAAAKPFAWGVNDCLLWLADWILDQREIDPAYDFRGKYSTMLGAARIIRDAGGMQGLVDRRASLAGLRRASPGSRGDIAIVTIAGESGEPFGNMAGAILLGGSAALLSQAGLVLPQRSQIEIVMAWRV
jgi:hypothetical protein